MLAGDGVFQQSVYGGQSPVDLFKIHAGPKQPGAQKAFAHGRKRSVEGAEESRVLAGIGEDGLDELQVADGDGVEHQAILALVVSDAVHMLE